MKIYKMDGSAPISLGDVPTTTTPGLGGKDALKKRLKDNVKRMAELQNMLYAQGQIRTAHHISGDGCGRQRQYDPPRDDGT